VEMWAVPTRKERHGFISDTDLTSFMTKYWTWVNTMGRKKVMEKDVSNALALWKKHIWISCQFSLASQLHVLPSVIQKVCVAENQSWYAVCWSRLSSCPPEKSRLQMNTSLSLCRM